MTTVESAGLLAPWRVQAACRDMDPNIFFPGRTDSLAPARAVCATCPVMAECRDYGLSLSYNEGGVYGGLSHKDRKSPYWRAYRLRARQT